MASAELRKLYKLHLIDTALLEIRKRAAALDPGKKLAAEITQLEEQLVATPGKLLQAELTDLELQQSAMGDKIKKYEGDLYGGKVVNPREVEAYEKELSILKRHRAELDDRMFALMERLPAEKANLDKLEQAIAERKKLLLVHQKQVMAEKTRLEEEFKQQSAARIAAAKEISPSVLPKYEQIRQKHGGLGMGEVVKGNCGACGTHLPERTIEALRQDRTVTCEACHRILYYTEGVV